MTGNPLHHFGLLTQAGEITVRSPIDGQVLGHVSQTPLSSITPMVERAHRAFYVWRSLPAPQRGELVRILGCVLRENKHQLADLVTLEAGKITSESLGEVQEMIDICDYAVGLSRQLYGLTLPSERPDHHMREVWHPLGPVAIITAFNFPVAVWAWNAAIALVCGNPVIWKPSDKTSLTACAVMTLFDQACARFTSGGGLCPPDLAQCVMGSADHGDQLAAHRQIPLVSATGSTRMGRAVAARVSARLGRSLLELGGNNAMIVTPSADLALVRRAALFSAAGTAGQRCTTLRRLIVHRSVARPLIDDLTHSYKSLRIGDPRDPSTLVGPLIDGAAAEAFTHAVGVATTADKGILHAGGTRWTPPAFLAGGHYVSPALIEMTKQTAIMREETFAPILYVLSYDHFEEALALNNDVDQGLSSCCMTLNIREAEQFLSASGSDCGIANINIGPSGAEIGGAFGGEKDTGGGRESGSDSWKAYMRRQTQTINYGTALPLAQGVVFDPSES